MITVRKKFTLNEYLSIEMERDENERRIYLEITYIKKCYYPMKMGYLGCLNVLNVEYKLEL
jgi:hypothetical protein